MPAFSIAATGTNSAATLDIAITIPSGDTDRFIVCTTHQSDSQTAITSVEVVGGSAFTFRVGVNGGAAARTELWSLIAPPTGAITVRVTFPDALGHSAGVASFTDCHQTTPIVSHVAEGGLDPITLDITSETGRLVYDGVGTHSASTFTPGAGQTERWEVLTGDNGSDCAGSTEAGAGTVTMSWTDIAGGANHAQIAIDIQPPAAAVTASRQYLLLGVGQ